MKVCGIIVEYNPFHNGHLYHLNKSKEITKADVVVAVMSSNFVQRGEPAIISKKKRVEEAIKQGVDLVVELPFLYSVESADIFAKYALSILNHLKVNNICFGSETGNTKEFLEKYEDSSLLTPHLDFLVSDLMDEGHSYPKAMSLALEQINHFKLETPNDILGLAYLREIKKNDYPIKIHTIKRSNDYNSLSIKEDIISATAIRNAIIKGIEIDKFTSMAKDLKENTNVYLEDFFNILKYKIISSSAEELSQIHLVNEGIENLFKKEIIKSKTMDDFIKRCVSRRYTFARIKRTIVHILCNTKKEFAQQYLSKDISYIRVLGFNDIGQKYLASIRKEMQVPILNKFRGKSFSLLQNEKMITYVYASNMKEPFKSKLYEEEHSLFPIKF